MNNVKLKSLKLEDIKMETLMDAQLIEITGGDRGDSECDQDNSSGCGPNA